MVTRPQWLLSLVLIALAIGCEKPSEKPSVPPPTVDAARAQLQRVLEQWKINKLPLGQSPTATILTDFDQGSMQRLASFTIGSGGPANDGGFTFSVTAELVNPQNYRSRIVQKTYSVDQNPASGQWIVIDSALEGLAPPVPGK